MSYVFVCEAEPYAQDDIVLGGFWPDNPPPDWNDDWTCPPVLAVAIVVGIGGSDRGRYRGRYWQ